MILLFIYRKIYFADERIVPLDHADSNYGALKKELLDQLPTSASSALKVFPIDPSLGSKSSEAVAEAYEETLHSTIHSTINVITDAATHESKLVPKFDLILLGCGPDGHTCSLFPGHPLLKEHDKLVASLDDSPKPPPSRVTLTKPVLSGASNIAFVAEGAAKAPVLEQILKEKNITYPSAQVNQIASSSVTWFVSDTAVKNLNLEGNKI